MLEKGEVGLDIVSGREGREGREGRRLELEGKG